MLGVWPLSAVALKANVLHLTSQMCGYGPRRSWRQTDSHGGGGLLVAIIIIIIEESESGGELRSLPRECARG